MPRRIAARPMEPLRTSTGFTRSASARKRTAAAATASTPRCALRDTQLLRLEDRKFFTGSAKAFDATRSTGSLRFDPEGVRGSPFGRPGFVSDQHGPHL